jgi:protein phosphatase
MNSLVRDEARAGTIEVGEVALRWAAVSDVGLVREANEDAAYVGAGLLLLADGMGGHDCGEIASAAALNSLAEVDIDDLESTRASVVERLQAAQSDIEGIDTDSGRRAGTTVTGAILLVEDGEPQWLVLNIGDSRTYRLLGGVLEQVTQDHSQVQELVDAGFITAEQARVDPRRNVITRALGAGMEPDADFFAVPVTPGERLLVCSDGLTGEVEDEQIGELLSANDDPADAAAALVAAALAGGGRDNITIIVADVLDGEAAQAAADDSTVDSEEATAATESADEAE